MRLTFVQQAELIERLGSLQLSALLVLLLYDGGDCNMKQLSLLLLTSYSSHTTTPKN